VEVLAPPDRLLGTEANVAVLIVGELRERVRQLDLRPGERPPGQLDGKALDDLARKRRLLPLAVLFLPCPGPICTRRESEDSTRQRPRSGLPENGATVHTNRVHTTFGPSSFSVIETCAHAVPRPGHHRPIRHMQSLRALPPGPVNSLNSRRFRCAIWVLCCPIDVAVLLRCRARLSGQTCRQVMSAARVSAPVSARARQDGHFSQRSGLNREVRPWEFPRVLVSY